MKTKIALIGFGGTIAMVPNRDGVLAPAHSAEDLVAQAPALSKIDCQLDIIQLQNKDSTNLNPQDWKLLIDKIAEVYTDYDGFLITHGTDTMSYTATAVSFALGTELSKPIVFTGAQLPMSDVGTDARSNLERATKFIVDSVHEKIAEVMIVFGDRILRASRSLKNSEANFDAFDSPAFPNLGRITASEIATIPLIRRVESEDITKQIYPKSIFSTDIITLDVKPGLEPELLLQVASSPKCRAVILRSLGAGNVPNQGRFSLLPAIQSTVDSGKSVIIASKFVGGRVLSNIYETGQAAVRVGAGHSGDMTDVATEVKLAWLLGQGITRPEDVKPAMLKNIIGEISE